MKLFLLIFMVFLSIFTKAQNKEIAITIDDLPNINGASSVEEFRAKTNALQKILKQNNIKVVGFVNEKQLYKLGEVDKIIKLLESWLANGHELGNHMFSHASFNETSLEDYKIELMKGEIVSKELAKKYNSSVKYFRYPYLQTGNDSLKRYSFETFLKQKNYINSPVTIDNEDWIFNDVYVKALKKNDLKKMQLVVNEYIKHTGEMIDYYEKISERIAGKQIKQTFLCHTNVINAVCFQQIIDLMKNKSYKFITLEEALKEPYYETKDTYVGKGGFSWIHRWRKSANISFDLAEPIILEEIINEYNNVSK